MGFIVLDSNALKQLEIVREQTEVRDEWGRVVGVFSPAKFKISEAERAELESRRANKTGRLFSEVLSELKAK